MNNYEFMIIKFLPSLFTHNRNIPSLSSEFSFSFCGSFNVNSMIIRHILFYKICFRKKRQPFFFFGQKKEILALSTQTARNSLVKLF